MSAATQTYAQTTGDYRPKKDAAKRKPSAAGALRAEAWRKETVTSHRSFIDFMRDGPLPESDDCIECNGTGMGQNEDTPCYGCRGKGF